MWSDRSFFVRSPQCRGSTSTLVFVGRVAVSRQELWMEEARQDLENKKKERGD